MARRRPRGAAVRSLLQKLLQYADDLLKKTVLQRSIANEIDLAKDMEAEMMNSRNRLSREEDDLLDKLNVIATKLIDEQFLYVTMVSDMNEVHHFRSLGYTGGVKIVGSSAWRSVLKSIADDCGLRVTE